MNPDLTKTIAQYLEDFDPIFGEQGIPLNHRALHAALFFVKELVLEVSTGAKDKPIGEPWFDSLHFAVLCWYHQRYGDAMDAGSVNVGRGVIAFSGTALTLTFPLTVSREGSKPSTKRMYFPDALRDDEVARSFLDARLTLDEFPEAARNQVDSDIATTIARTRQLSRNLSFAKSTPQARQLSNRAMWTLGQAVASIGAGATDRLGLAMWELNLLGELCLKVFIHQREQKPPNIHGVAKLHEIAVSAGMPAFESSELERFPSERSAIRYRYGEEVAPRLATAVALYCSALALAVHCSSNLAHGIRARADGWIEFRTIGSLSHGA